MDEATDTPKVPVCQYKYGIASHLDGENKIVKKLHFVRGLTV